MAMQPKTWSINGLATELGVDRRTIAKRIAEAQIPVAETRAGSPRYRLRDVVEALGRRRNGSTVPEMSRREALNAIALCQEHLVPWAHDDVVPLDEYEREVGIADTDEILDWITYGFPLLPPAEGEKLARVSVPHAELWRLLFGGLIHCAGGDGKALHLGHEMRRLRGLPL